jgi:hypothetical protein
MLNKNAKLWVKALRSGIYRQGKGVLRTTSNEFCCLGVACDLAVKAGVLKEDATLNSSPSLSLNSTSGPDGFYYGECADSSKFGLPVAVREWLGISGEGIFSEPINECRYLSDLNDHGFTFEQIAKVITSEPEGLFKTSTKV